MGDLSSIDFINNEQIGALFENQKNCLWQNSLMIKGVTNFWVWLELSGDKN